MTYRAGFHGAVLHGSPRLMGEFRRKMDLVHAYLMDNPGGATPATIVQSVLHNRTARHTMYNQLLKLCRNGGLKDFGLAHVKLRSTPGTKGGRGGVWFVAIEHRDTLDLRRVCTVCKRERPVSAFTVDNGISDLSAECWECSRTAYEVANRIGRPRHDLRARGPTYGDSKLCHKCYGLPHRRPLKRSCVCGELWGPDVIMVDYERRDWSRDWQ